MRNRIIKLIGEAATTDPNIMFMTGDLGFSVVEPLQESMGERFVNMGISEANMVSVASSLVASGFNVFTYTIAPFMTARCFEQIRNDACYQGRPIKLIGVGGGYSYGSLGPSHHSLEDAHILAALPDLVIGNPANVNELDRFFHLTLNAPHTVYFRIPRESGVPRDVPSFDLETGAYLLADGEEINIVASGVSINDCVIAVDRLRDHGVKARLISVPVIRPFPHDHLAGLLADGPVLTVFEGYGRNPLSVGVMETLLRAGRAVPFADLHVEGFAHTVGNTEHLRAAAGLDAGSIEQRALALLAGRTVP